MKIGLIAPPWLPVPPGHMAAPSLSSTELLGSGEGGS